jgi:hypothetical protein
MGVQVTMAVVIKVLVVHSDVVRVGDEAAHIYKPSHSNIIKNRLGKKKAAQ